MPKNHYCILLIIFIFLLFKDFVFAVSCKELDSPEKIKSFMNESHLSSPFLRKNVSVTVILDACEGKVCKSKSKREAQKETLLIQRLDNKRRIFAQEGPNAPRCVIQRGARRFVCSSCGAVSNENCRSFPSDESTIFLVQTLIQPILSLFPKMWKRWSVPNSKIQNILKLKP